MTQNLPAIDADNLPFDQMLAYAIAENRVANPEYLPWTEEELCEQFDITIDILRQLKQSKKFAKAVTIAVADLKRNSGAIEAKARQLYEHYQDTLIPAMMEDDKINPAEKVKLLTLLAKTAKVFQENNISSGSPSAPAMPTLNIILTQAPAPAPQPQIKDVTDVE